MPLVRDAKPAASIRVPGRCEDPALVFVAALTLALLLAILLVSPSQAAAERAVNLGAERSHPAGDLPYSVETADLNGDGVLDIVTPNTVSHDVSVLLGRGEGTFRPAANFPAGKGPRTAVTADFDEDGRVDVAVSDVFDRAVLVLRGDGRGGLGPPTRYPAGEQPRNLITRDLDRDGHADLA
ncbi:MAG: VCBS repeat-containing protein, partial [Thermoleophilaceae bacterium]|nr:VCBS repeat-containing protein [Thermoleophilaceae bacterium]